jgi:hypothetical protein
VDTDHRGGPEGDRGMNPTRCSCHAPIQGVMKSPKRARTMAAAQMPRNPLHTPPARPQTQHLGHVVRRLHYLPPWIVPRRGFLDSLLVYPLSPQLAKEGAIPRGAEGAIFHGARHCPCAKAQSVCSQHHAHRLRWRRPAGVDVRLHFRDRILQRGSGRER